MWGVFCEYFNDCAHYTLKYITDDEMDAVNWAIKTSSLNVFCKIAELKLGNFEINDIGKDINDN